MAPDLHEKMKRSRHFVLPSDGGQKGAAAWTLWLRNEYGIFEKVSYGGCVRKNASAMFVDSEVM